MNEVKKIVYNGNSIYFILQTEGDQDFWWWEVSVSDVRDYFVDKGLESIDNASAVYELACEKLSKAHAEQFCNDADNDTLGCSCASFETAEEATMDVLKK